MRILFAGGGTAGHVNPAVAIAEAMKRKNPKSEFAFVGRLGGDENRIIERAGFKLYTLKVRGIQRKLSPSGIKSIFLALKALGAAGRIIEDFKPDVIVGTGGYVSWPVLKKGIAKGIPTVLHESNIYPGLVTRTLGAKCTKVLLNSKESLNFLKKCENAVEVGNPLREEFRARSRSGARRALGLSDADLFIVSFGGSLGAEKINRAVIDLMESYTSKTPAIKHLHSAGTRYFDEIKRDYEKFTHGIGGCTVKPYVDNMPTAMTAADLVICRSGAMTLSEIAKAGVASILIPSPNVADNHQYKNASVLAERGAAVVIKEEELDSDLLKNTVFDLLTDAHRRASLASKIKEFHDPDATEKICKEIENSVSLQKPSAPF